MPEASKNIVICCDGTGNEFGDANSNVVKLYTALAIDDSQIGYYHPGVGTMGDPAERHRVSRWWSRIKGLAFAAGFKANVFDAYSYLMANYNDGDRVYLFGFSRGAYTVRALAGLLDGYGLLCRGNEGHLPYAWRLYVDQHDDRLRHSVDHNKDSAAAFKETFSRKHYTIHFVGIWDTVSSIGWVSTPLRLFNVSQNATIRHGRHAISIDERRCFYHDNLWGEPLHGQDIEQVWFPGAHSDVGGSYPQKSSGLSNITLEWMINEARAAGLRLVEDRVNLVLGRDCTSYPEAKPLYEKPSSSVVHHSLRYAWWILEFFPHIYYDKDYGEELYRIPFGARRQLPAGAFVHHSAKERIEEESARYRPANVMCGTLTPLANRSGHPLADKLYIYNPVKPGKSSWPKRWAVIVLFVTLYLAGALSAFLLAIKWYAQLSPSVWHICQLLLHSIPTEYSKLSAWTMAHFGPHVHRIFF